MAVAKKSSLLNKVEGFFAPTQSLTPLKKKKILVVGPEVSPYANVGGVSHVLAYLSTALMRSGHDVRVLMPKFGFIDGKEFDLEMVHEGLEVPTGNSQKPVLICNIKKYQVPGGAPVYFLENQEYYELRANVYGYADDPI